MFKFKLVLFNNAYMHNSKKKSIRKVHGKSAIKGFNDMKQLPIKKINHSTTPVIVHMKLKTETC